MPAAGVPQAVGEDQQPVADAEVPRDRLVRLGAQPEDRPDRGQVDGGDPAVVVGPQRRVVAGGSTLDELLADELLSAQPDGETTGNRAMSAA